MFRYDAFICSVCISGDIKTQPKKDKSYKYRYMDLFVVILGDAQYHNDVKIILDNGGIQYKVYQLWQVMYS